MQQVLLPSIKRTPVSDHGQPPYHVVSASKKVIMRELKASTLASEKDSAKASLNLAVIPTGYLSTCYAYDLCCSALRLLCPSRHISALANPNA